MKTNLLKIIKELKIYFNNGISIKSEVLFFLSSTLGIENNDEIKDFILSEELYLSGVLDLLFYPEKEIQLKVEPYISLNGECQKSIILIKSEIIENFNMIKLHMPTEEIIDFPLNRDVIIFFINKLRLDKNIPFEKERDYAENKKLLYYSMRNLLRSNKQISSNTVIEKITVLLDSIVNDNTVDETFSLDCFKIAVELLSEIPEGNDIYQTLSQRKKNIEKSITDSKNTRERVKRETVETMMMDRSTMNLIDTEKAEKEIDYIDRISLYLFGMEAGFINGKSFIQ